MTISQLIEKLKDYPPDMQIMILDSFNGGGCPRDLNCGPYEALIEDRHAEIAADCEGREGEQVVLIGYGCY